MSVNRATIVANINGEKGDKCYISAGRSGSNEKGEKASSSRGMLFYKCHIRLATEDELVNRSVSPKDGLPGAAGLYSVSAAVYLARPWRSWGETVWAYTTWDEGVLNPDGWSTGLIQKRPEFDSASPCPRSYEYKSQDGSAGRPKWVSVLRRPILPDGTRLNPKAWIAP